MATSPRPRATLRPAASSIDGNSVVREIYPSIAGQNEPYMAHQLALSRRRRARQIAPAAVIAPGAASDQLLAALPFQLTDAQAQALAEIRRDLASGQQMGRLLQGDVGSGKTAVAALALLAAHPEDVSRVVAHEPPVMGVLPDAELAERANDAVGRAYQERGWGAGLAAFLAMSMWQGEFTEEFLAQPLPAPNPLSFPFARNRLDP
mgnify:CR=1 FL=1